LRCFYQSGDTSQTRILSSNLFIEFSIKEVYGGLFFIKNDLKGGIEFLLYLKTMKDRLHLLKTKGPLNKENHTLGDETEA